METTVLHKMHCQEPWFSYLRDGVKPVEGRKNTPKYSQIKPEDIILFYNGKGEEFTAMVEKIDMFKDLNDYLNTVTLAKALPGVENYPFSR